MMTKNKINQKNPLDKMRAFLPKKRMRPLLFTGILNSVKDVNKIPFDSFEYESDVIKHLIQKQNKKLIKYNDFKVFFINPKIKSHAIDIFGCVYNIEGFVKRREIIYGDKIFIESDNGCESYNYMQFRKECLPQLKTYLYYKMSLKNIDEAKKENDTHYSKEKRDYHMKKKCLIKNA